MTPRQGIASSNTRGIDANVELGRLLDQLSADSPLAARAPRGKGLYKYLAAGLAAQGYEGAYWQLTETLLTRLSVWWSAWGYEQVPVMVPWAIRDRSARYDQGPESWGAPRADGYFRDDNSIIKKLALPLTVIAPVGHPFAGQKPWRGFTACHIWRTLPGGTVAGEDPFLYSFMPNLVWLPTAIAPLSDRQESHVQRVLQRTSLLLYRGAGLPSLRKYTDHAKNLLVPPPDGLALDLTRLAMFSADASFKARRVAYLDKFIAGADSVVRTGVLPGKLISSRYTAGLPLLERSAVALFRDTLSEYRDALTGAPDL